MTLFHVFWEEATGLPHCDRYRVEAMIAVCHAMRLIEYARQSNVSKVWITNRNFSLVYEWRAS